ncbi:MAG: CoA transferase [Pseudomonadota bacterium]
MGEDQRQTTARVVELGAGVAGNYAAKLLADYGADVINIESPEGDPLRRRGAGIAGQESLGSGYFQALNLNKRSVTLDLDLPSVSGALDAYLAWADICVLSLDNATAARLHLTADALATRHPQLVVLSITPFGRVGPYANYQATDLTLSNAGGWANLCPATHLDPALPPLKVYGDQCALMAAIAGATTALATLLDVTRSGVGEYIDVSIQEYVASVLEVGIPAYSYRGEVATRAHPRSLIPWRIFDAKDGPVFVVCVEQDQWQRLQTFMGNPEWAQMEVFAEQPDRAENQDLVHSLVQEFVSEWSALEFYHAAQEYRICVAPVLDLERIAANEHLLARDFFVPLDLGQGAQITVLAPAILGLEGRLPIRGRAPRAGEHEVAPETLAPQEPMTNTEPAGAPLAGVRVLDMTWAWAGPYCSMNLAHLGAEVIRLESAERPDLYRRLPVHVPELDEGLNRSGMFNQWNQGKHSVGVDLSTDEGIDLVRRLVAVSDVVVQNFATGVMERMGLGYDTLRSINQGIIVASISGYGQTGPYRDYMGYGPAMPPLTGLSAATGYVDGAAEEIGLSMPDPTAGITAALGIVAALHQRQQTGRGDHLDITLWEATGVLNAQGWMHYQMTGSEPERIGNRDPDMAPHCVFPTAGEDCWISIACRDDADWLALAGVIEPSLADEDRFADLAGRKQHEAELEALICAWSNSRDRWEITRTLQALGIPAFPTMTTEDIVHDEHLAARGFIERLEHPEVGARAHAGIPWQLRQRACRVRRPAPCLGADTRTYARLAGYGDDQIEAWLAKGILSEPG